MALITSLLASFQKDEEGQGLAEYALILALIAIVAIVALIFLGGQVSQDPVDGRQLRSSRRSHPHSNGRRDQPGSHLHVQDESPASGTAPSDG